MVVGLDVTHPTGETGDKDTSDSVAAMVASTDINLSQWPADLRIQVQSKQEMVTMAGSMLESRLALWSANHQSANKPHKTIYPQNILIYRDGVSEGQYPQVLEKELDPMRNICTQLYKAAGQISPKFTLIIAAKRHHTRFYRKTPQDPKNPISNPQNGTVVDRTVTCVWDWDFFLQSHTAIQGTARPAQYIVLWDEILCASGVPDPAGELQRLTHHLCYISGRATTATGLVAPVYYADMACERARCYFRGQNLRDNRVDWTTLTDARRRRGGWRGE